MPTLTEPLRAATLDDLATALTEQHAAKYDVAVTARTLRVDAGRVVVPGAGPAQLTLDGVDAAPGTFTPTQVAIGHLADLTGIPVRYMRRMHDTGAVSLFDDNANHWLADLPADKRVLVRTFRTSDDGGIVRALLSDRYRALDNLDALMAALDGIRSTGHDVTVDSIDLTERAMRVRLYAPGVQALAPVLLAGYRPPSTTTPAALAHGYHAPGAEPVVFAGFMLTNSETGGGAFAITPRLVVQACSNGLTITRDAARNVHLGGRLDAGVVRWSDATHAANVALIREQAADSVRGFLSPEYVAEQVRQIEARAGVEVDDPQATVERVSTTLGYTQAERATLLAHFIGGGQATLGGLVNAATSMAQTVEDADRAAEIEAGALAILAV